MNNQERSSIEELRRILELSEGKNCAVINEIGKRFLLNGGEAEEAERVLMEILDREILDEDDEHSNLLSFCFLTFPGAKPSEEAQKQINLIKNNPDSKEFLEIVKNVQDNANMENLPRQNRQDKTN